MPLRTPRRSCASLVLALGMLAGLPAHGQTADADPPDRSAAVTAEAPTRISLADWLKFDGFGTLSAYRADDEVASLRPDARSANASRRDIRYDGDSLISAQLTLNPNGPLRVVWQLLARDDIVLRYRPRTEWLYLQWEPQGHLSLRAGRLALPAFLLSETRNVAYAQTNVRPFSSLYPLNPITTLDGLGAIWRQPLAGGDLSLDAVLGSARINLTTGRVEAERISGLAAQWKRGPVSLRLGRSDYRLDAQLPATLSLLQTLASGATGCSNCAAVLAGRAPGRFKAALDTAALTLELGDWSVQSEWMRRRSGSVLVPDSVAWYAQLSRRIGAFTPFLGLGQTRFTEAALGLRTVAGAPPAVQAGNLAIDRYLQSANDRRSWQAGLRWDCAENMALKLHLEWLKNTQETRLGQTGTLSYPAIPPIGSYSGPAWDGRLRAIGLNLDFVF